MNVKLLDKLKEFFSFYTVNTKYIPQLLKLGNKSKYYFLNNVITQQINENVSLFQTSMSVSLIQHVKMVDVSTQLEGLDVYVHQDMSWIQLEHLAWVNTYYVSYFGFEILSRNQQAVSHMSRRKDKLLSFIILFKCLVLICSH